MKSILACAASSILLLASTQSALGENPDINVLGCVLPLKNVSDITINGAANISLTYQQSNTSPLRIITISKYLGDKFWYLEKQKNNVSHTDYGKYLNLYLKTMTFYKKFPRGTEFQFLTDKKVMLLFKGKQSEIRNFLKCGGNQPSAQVE
ncbi:MAG TPA: hypothetical protein VFN13_08230 [Rudaea sp.]|nr:hypothetical protein [Rudaea sp.]